MPADRLVTIETFPTPAEAHAARLLLHANGISAVVADDTMVGGLWYLGNAMGGVKLQVAAKDAERADELLDQHLYSDAEPGADEGSAWQCTECRHEVPAGFEVCWSCGEPRRPHAQSLARSEADDVSVPRPPSSAAPVVPEPVCRQCGATLRSDLAACPSCGHERELNPFDPPLTESAAAPVRMESGALRRQREADEATAERAWKAAIFGLIFLPVVFYSLFLLFRLATPETRLSPRLVRRVRIAWVIDLLLLALGGTVFSLRQVTHALRF